MNQTLFEKLFFTDEKNILVQGTPVSIERTFIKLRYSKNVTPLLKNKKIDFALLFAINKIQLEKIAPEVLDAMGEKGKLWIAFPKSTSKIVSDLTHVRGWNVILKRDYQLVRLIAIDHVWSGARFEKKSAIPKTLFPTKIESVYIDYEKQSVIYPEDLKNLFEQFEHAQLFFESLIFDLKRNFILWLEAATNMAEREERLKHIIEQTLQGSFEIAL